MLWYGSRFAFCFLQSCCFAPVDGILDQYGLQECTRLKLSDASTEKIDLLNRLVPCSFELCQVYGRCKGQDVLSNVGTTLFD